MNERGVVKRVTGVTSQGEGISKTKWTTITYIIVIVIIIIIYPLLVVSSEIISSPD